MDWLVFLGVAMALAALAAVAHRRGWIDLSNKSRSGGKAGGGTMGIGDEVFNPSRYEAQIELDRQSVLPAPAPLAGDGDKDIYKGNVRIDLSAG